MHGTFQCAALWLLLIATGWPAGCGPPSIVAADSGTGAIDEWRPMAAGPQLAVAADGRRRSRVSREFAGDVTAQSAPVTEQLATSTDAAAAEALTEVVTVPAGVELPARELGDLLHMDTDKFSDKQKQLFKKIVERVARVSIAANEATAQQKQQLLKLQLDAEEAEAETAAADDDADRAPAVEEGRDSKVRQTKIKYPASQTLTTISVGGGKLPGSKPAYASASSSSSASVGNTNTANTATTAIKQRPGVAQRPTGAPQSEADKQKYKLVVNTNIARPASSVPTKMDNYTEVIFGNITTTSIVDSLSNDNSREQLLHAKNGQQQQQLKKRPPTTAAAMPATPDTAAASAAELAENKKEPQIATAKPTKYHYYPHNQHIYLLPECAIQQVCNAVYVRLNYTQPLCACPSRYRDPCSASINEDDLHTTKLIGDDNKKAITLAKTCESTTEMRECRSPRDWSLLALQNTRTGKSHYLVICRCPDNFILEGPMAHDQPTYASVPGIRVFGMMCIKPGAGANRKPPQVPKRDHLYQQQQHQHHQQQQKLNYQYQQQQQQLQSAYQQQQQLSQQQQYQSQQQQQQQPQQQQPNYQYLHRATSDRPVPSQSTPRSNSYQPHSVYHHQQLPIVQPHFETIYDDVYARNGAGIEAVDPAANGTSSTSTNSDAAAIGSSSSSSSPPASSSSSSSHSESTAGITAYTAPAQAAAQTTQQQQTGDGRTETLSSAETTVATPAASASGSAEDGAEERSNSGSVSDSQEDQSSRSGASNESASNNDIGSDETEATSAQEDQSQSAAAAVGNEESSSAADSTAEETEEEEEEATTAAGSAGARRRRRAARFAAPDEDNLQAKLEAIIDQLLLGGGSESGALNGVQQRLGRAQLVSEILTRRK